MRPVLCTAIAGITAIGALVVVHCAGSARRELHGDVPIMTVLAPRPDETDMVSRLTDGVIERDGWYCSEQNPPQRYEFMTADGASQLVRAVGFVAANVGADGLGTIEVRVQQGHGVMAQGATVRATIRGRVEGLQVVRLATPVQGDHVLLTLLDRSQYSTARCLGEVVVFTSAETYRQQRATVVRGAPYTPTDARPDGSVDASNDVPGDVTDSDAADATLDSPADASEDALSAADESAEAANPDVLGDVATQHRVRDAALAGRGH